MNAVFTRRMETLKLEINDALEKGIFADLPADESGITPDTRLQWGIDSIIYIIGISNGIGDTFDYGERNDSNETMLIACHKIKALSKDPYIAEGIFNIQWVLTILGIIAYSPGEVMDELYYQSIRATVLERQMMEYEARYDKAQREAKRLTMLLNQVADAIENGEKSRKSY